MILAAGLGTRLQPLTNTIPKALMTVGGKTMLELVSEKLIQAGITDIVVNIHHHAQQMRSFIRQMQYPGVKFHISDETTLLLNTGGGIKKARQLLDGDQAFFVYNIDIISDIDLGSMLETHRNTGALATLAVSKRKASRYFLWENGFLSGWQNVDTGETIEVPAGQNQREHTDRERKAFSGIHIIEPAIFNLMDEKGIFSVVDVYLRLAATHPIACFEHNHQAWFDIGTPEKLHKAQIMHKTK